MPTDPTTLPLNVRLSQLLGEEPEYIDLGRGTGGRFWMRKDGSLVPDREHDPREGFPLLLALAERGLRPKIQASPSGDWEATTEGDECWYARPTPSAALSAAAVAALEGEK